MLQVMPQTIGPRETRRELRYRVQQHRCRTGSPAAIALFVVVVVLMRTPPGASSFVQPHRAFATTFSSPTPTTVLSSILDEQQAAVEDHDPRQLKYDAERYKNRATILEHALQHKLSKSSNNLSDQKLSVLQDAVHRLVRKHERHENQIARDLARAKKEALSLEAARDEGVNHWKVKYDSAQEERKEALETVQSLRAEIQQIKQESKLEVGVLQSNLHELQTSYDLDQKIWDETFHELQQAQKEVSEVKKRSELKIQQLQQEKRELQAENVSLQEKLQHEHERSRRWKAKWKTASDQQQTLQLEYDALLEQQQEISRDQQEQESPLDHEKYQQQQEAIEIAQAAVAAAERREQELRNQYETLAQKHESVLQEKQLLSLQLEREKETQMRAAGEREAQKRQSREEEKVQINSNKPLSSSTKPEPLDPILEHAAKVVHETTTETTEAETTESSQGNFRKSRIVQKFIGTLRPGTIGATLQNRHLTFEPPQSRWGFIKSLLPRIPFRVSIVRNRNDTSDEKH